MKIGMNGRVEDIGADMLHVTTYPNDMMNGMLINLPDQYGFVSEHDDERSDMILEAMEEGAPHYDLSDCDIDLTQPPHSWIVNGLTKLVIETATEVCMEAAEEQ